MARIFAYEPELQYPARDFSISFEDRCLGFARKRSIIILSVRGCIELAAARKHCGFSVASDSTTSENLFSRSESPTAIPTVSRKPRTSVSLLQDFAASPSRPQID